MVELLASKGKLCTGCGACYNVCPKDAIRMEPNEEGFLVPRIQIQLEELRRKTDCDKMEFQNQLNDLRNSPSWRIGRAITWLPRKVRGGYRCVKENGWKYTIRHLGEKIKGKLHI